MTPAERAFCCRYFSEFFRGLFHDSVGSYWPAVSEALQDTTTPIIVTQAERQAWAKLFFGVGAETIPLSESAWGNEMHLTNQAPCLAARETYRAAGVTMKTDDNLPEDHLSVLLGFLAYSIENKRDTKAFVNDHFGEWLDRLSAKVHTTAENKPILVIWDAFDLFLKKERVLNAAA